MSELTPERLAELRRIAEAATPGPWRISDDPRYDDVPADRFVIASAEREHIAETTPGGSFTNEDLANARHIATFDPPTVLALLDEIERLRRERETLVEAAWLAKEAADEAHTDRRDRARRFRRWVAQASSDELRAKVLEMAALLKEELVHYILTDDPDGEYCIECRTWDGHKRHCWAGRAEAALRAPGGVRRG